MRVKIKSFLGLDHIRLPPFLNHSGNETLHPEIFASVARTRQWNDS